MGQSDVIINLRKPGRLIALVVLDALLQINLPVLIVLQRLFVLLHLHESSAQILHNIRKIVKLLL